MFDTVLLFLGSLFNLLIDLIYKIVRGITITFLILFALMVGFALILVGLVR